MIRIFVLAAVAVLLFSCNPKEKTKDAANEQHNKDSALHYAKGFLIQEYDGCKKVIVRHPQDTNKILATYILIPDGVDTPKIASTDIIFRIPLKKIACVSTTHVGILEKLNLVNTIVGISGTKYIYDAHVNALIADGSIAELGFEGSFDFEKIIALQPDAIITYQYDDPAYDAFGKFNAVGLHTILNNEYLELTPLGQAEWMKFIAAFFDVSEMADSVFNAIEKSYLEIKEQAIALENHPTVFTGLPFKGEWTVPGGKSFAATYLSDAGAEYLWKEDNRTGNFPIAFEQVIATALNAEYWLHAGASKTLNDIAKADSRLTSFDAWKKGNVFNNNKRLNETGGNDYWESGIVNPNLVLKDLVKILHPDLFPTDTLNYYTQLK